MVEVICDHVVIVLRGQGDGKLVHECDFCGALLEVSVREAIEVTVQNQQPRQQAER